MLKLKKVAVTGGIAAGKSTVCRLFEEFGAFAVSADEITHQLLDPSTDLGKKIVQLLGEKIVVGDKLDRVRIAKKVFNNLPLLEKLEKLIHPEVKKVLEEQYQVASACSYPLFVAEIPLLFEGGFEKEFDVLILVDADEKECQNRFVKLGYDEQEFQKRSKRLIPKQKKISRVDFIIDNSGSYKQLRKEVQSIFNSLTG